MPDRQLFGREEETLQNAESFLESHRDEKSPFFTAFKDLIKGYKRMLKQLRILVSMGDKQQRRLNDLNDQLELSNRFIKKTFGQYLSEDIAETILGSPKGALPGGEKRVITIMMSDLRGFTPITERLPAESVLGMINIYLEAMTNIILKYRGTIDEFYGDGILALFGAPVRRDDDARRAVACAVEMQSAMDEVNRLNREAGYPAVGMGIGINTGELVVGNIGSQKRTKYGVVGSNVNLTSRIESYTVGGQIFISAGTLESCGPILRIDDQMEVTPKGVKEPVTIYDIGGIGGEYDLFLPGKTEMPVTMLEKPLPVAFSVLSGKRVGAAVHPGVIIGMSGGEAEIQSDIAAGKLEDLRIVLFDHAGCELASNLYAKVVKTVSESPPVFRVNFTSATPEVREFLAGLIPRPG